MNEDYLLHYGQTVTIDDTRWTVEGFDQGREVLLREQGGDRHMTISMGELFTIMGPAKAAIDVELHPDGNDWPEDVLDAERHLLEVFQGTPMTGVATPSRGGFDPRATTQEQRIKAKVAELAGTSAELSRKTMFRHWTIYKHAGAAGLNAVMHRKGKQRLEIAKADWRLVEVIDLVLDERATLHTASRRKSRSRIMQLLEERYPGDPILSIAPRTLQGYINERDKGRYTFEKATTRRTANNRPNRAYGSSETCRLGDRVEMDSTPMDLWVLDSNGIKLRPYMALGIT